MRSLCAAVVAAIGLVLVVSPAQAAPANVQGIDVSGPAVDWSHWWDQGKRFTAVKATEGTSYSNPGFPDLARGAANAGFLLSAFHFARPDASGGAAQADYFVDHGGGWSADGKTLPGTLDIEWNPYGPACYGLNAATTVAWIKAFSERYHARTTRWPTIYTSTGWWTQCTGHQGDFSADSPLWIASYGDTPGPLPYRWADYTFWQYGDSGTAGIGLDEFNGTYGQLTALATG
jgi:GH25 family lysozyme M1 (1,4-beta-N-acetylmuramidase)